MVIVSKRSVTMSRRARCRCRTAKADQRDDASAVSGGDQRLEVCDAAAERGAGAALLALLHNLGFAHRAAERLHGKIPRLGDFALEGGVIHRASTRA